MINKKRIQTVENWTNDSVIKFWNGTWYHLHTQYMQYIFLHLKLQGALTLRKWFICVWSSNLNFSDHGKFLFPFLPFLSKVKLALLSLGTNISQTNEQNLNDILAYMVVFKSYAKITAIHGYIHMEKNSLSCSLMICAFYSMKILTLLNSEKTKYFLKWKLGIH